MSKNDIKWINSTCFGNISCHLEISPSQLSQHLIVFSSILEEVVIKIEWCHITHQNPNFSSLLQKQKGIFPAINIFSCWTSRPSPSMSSLILDPKIGLRYDFLVSFPSFRKNNKLSNFSRLLKPIKIMRGR